MAGGLRRGGRTTKRVLFIEIMPSRRKISGWLVISCWRIAIRWRKKVQIAVHPAGHLFAQGQGAGRCVRLVFLAQVGLGLLANTSKAAAALSAMASIYL